MKPVLPGDYFPLQANVGTVYTDHQGWTTMRVLGAMLLMAGNEYGETVIISANYLQAHPHDKRIDRVIMSLLTIADTAIEEGQQLIAAFARTAATQIADFRCLRTHQMN